MPTARPRLTITLTPEIDRALGDFSRLTGSSKSAFIVDMLGQSVPYLTKMAVVLQQATQLEGKAREAAKTRMASVAEALVAQASSTMRNADLFMDSMAGGVGGARTQEHADPDAASHAERNPSPPHPNRGGRPRNPGGKVVKIGSAKRGS